MAIPVVVTVQAPNRQSHVSIYQFNDEAKADAFIRELGRAAVAVGDKAADVTASMPTQSR